MRLKTYFFQIPEEFGSPRVFLKEGDGYLVGTTNNCLLRISLEGDVNAITQVGQIWFNPRIASDYYFNYINTKDIQLINSKYSFMLEFQNFLILSCHYLILKFC